MAFNNPIFIKWNEESELIENEQLVVTNTTIATLSQVPEEFQHVQIDNMYEVKWNNPITSSNQFSVNYRTGIITFHPSKIGQVITVSKYYGLGVLIYPASRIYDNSTGNVVDLETTKTLEDYINSVKPYGYQGDFDITKTYDPNSMVYYDAEKTVYRCKLVSVGILPTNTTYWQPMISVKTEASYAKTQGDYAKQQGDYASTFNSRVSSIETELGNDTLNTLDKTIKGAINEIDAKAISSSNITNTAYVEINGNDSTAILGRVDKPFKTINAAMDSLPSMGGVIKLGLGIFSPIDKDKWKDNVTIIGSKMPVIKSDNTGLENGTIIQAPLIRINKNGTKLFNLGVDGGSSVCNELYGGVAQEGINITCTSPAHEINNPNTGVVLENIIAICKDNWAAVHAILIEGVDGAYGRNLVAYFGIHGVVFKALNSNFSNIRTFGNNENGMIVRDSPYARCSNCNIDNVIVRSWVAPTGGLTLDASENVMNLHGININNVVVDNGWYGLRFYSNNTDSYIVNCNINNVYVNKVLDEGQGLGQGIKFIGNVKYNTFNNIQVVNPKTDGILFSASSTDNTFSNIKLLADGTNTGYGIKFDGTNQIISDALIKGFAVKDIYGAGSNIRLYNVKTSSGNLLNDIANDPNPLNYNDADINVKLPVILNGLANLGNGNSTAKYWKEGNKVFLEGTIYPCTPNTVVFTLPDGYRPPAILRFVVTKDTDFAKIIILTTGEVKVEAGTGGWFVLDGITFRI